MKKRILSIVLAICLLLSCVPITVFAAGDYDLYIGDIAFKKSESNVTKKVTGGGTATLVRGTDSATLTLNGINLTFGIENMGAIECDIENVTIVLSGTNTITLTKDNMAGIYLLKNATVKGNSGSKLIINANSNRIFGINTEVNVNLTVDNLNMTLNYKNTTNTAVGIRCRNVLTMKNSCTYTINGTVDALSGDTIGYYGLDSTCTLNIGNNANIKFDGWESGLDISGTFNLTGGTVSITNGYDAICNKGTMNLTGGTLNSSGQRSGILTGANGQTKFAGANATIKGGEAGWAYQSATASYSITGGKVVLEGGSYAASIKYSSLGNGLSVYAGSDKDNVSLISSPTDSTFGYNKYVRIEPSTYYNLTLVNVKGATSASHIYGSDISYTAADAPNEQHFAYWEMQVNGGTPVKVGTSATYKGKMPCANATLTAVYEDCYGGTATCQKLAICSVCGKEHGILALHSFTAEVVDDKYAITPVTCDGAGTYYKSCPVCGASSKNWNNATFTVSAHGHSYTKKVTSSDYLKTAAANCTQKNIYWYVCSYCNACAKDDPAASDKYYTGTTVGPHIYTEKIEDSAHYVAGSGANCQSAKQYYYDCAYCNQIGTSKWNSTTYGPHNYETVWSSNEAGHWHSCSLCDSKADEATHTPDRTAATETEPIKCTVCDYIIAPVIEHTHNLTLVAANPPTCTNDGNIAYYVCSTCKKMFADASGNNEITAKDIVDTAKGHNYEWVIDKQPTETEKGSKHQECTVCHDKQAAVDIAPLGTQTEQLQKLLDAGSTVVLDKDYTINKTLNINNAVTLDLNGHIINMVGSGNVLSLAKSSSNLTLIDSNKTAKHPDYPSLPDGGVITGGNSVERGGGVYLTSGSFTMSGGTIYNCSATNYGGGVYVNTNSHFIMTGGTIAKCKTTGSSSYGGGVYVSAHAEFTMDNGTIDNCSSEFLGGGVYVYMNSSFTMNDGTIQNCSTGHGGGVYLHKNSSFTMNGGNIEDCSARLEGNAVSTKEATIIANGGSIHGTVDLDSNCKIENTSSDKCTLFYDEVTNKGTINGGVYYGGISNDGGTISGTYYTVSFDLNGGGSAVKSQYLVNTSKGLVLKPTTDPTKKGYQAFDGWYNGNTKYDFTKPVTQSITLTAKYKNPTVYTISYDLGGGTATNPLTYNIESSAITLNAPIRAGYKFVGWSGTELSGDNNMTVTILTGSTDDRVYTAHWTDVEAPTGQISIGTSSWKEFLNNITFDLFFKNTQSVTITASDNGGEAVTIKYLLSDKELTVAQLNSATFTTYNGAFSINPDNKYVIYAKLTDKSGNVAYINSEGIVLDKTAPVISGIENGKVYCDAVEFTVTDSNGVESVKANNVKLTAVNGKYTLAKGTSTVTIVATDRAKNEATITITVNNGHTDTNKDHACDYCDANLGTHADINLDHKCDYGCSVVIGTHEDTNSDHKCDYGCSVAIGVHEDTNTDHKCDYGCSVVIGTHEDTNTDHKCDYGCSVAIGTHEDTNTDHKCDYGCSVAIGVHEDTNTDHKCDYGCDIAIGTHEDTNNDHNCDYCGGVITTCVDDDRNHFCDICSATLSEHTGGKATCVAKAICEYCNAEYGELDGNNHKLEKIFAKASNVIEIGNIEYWHCLDCGKYFADENGTTEITLADTVIAKLPPEIIEGKGQSITAGEKKELTFKSNAAFSDFIRAQLDGKNLDEKNYTVKEGSTIVTLKADYVATLSVGEHTIGIVSASGTATTTFTINTKPVVETTVPTQTEPETTVPALTENSTTVPAQTENEATVSSQSENDSMTSPETGNESNMALLLIFLISCGGVIVVTGAYSKRKKHSAK